ncbi:MAG TPA: polysaccharide biosynthesis/export family protein [Phycisphaerae bacterium]|nr:polysaccharide biosynthesis/export family protein [Phycisphaerae bacterium]
MPPIPSGPARLSMRRVKILALACVAATAGGCADLGNTIGDYLNLRNSFLAPNEVGRFDKGNPWGNVRPLPMPILDQVDVNDEPADRWANATEPTPADLIPSRKEQLIGPGDIVRVTAWELQQPGMEYQREAQVSEEGNITIAALGSVNIGGLTPHEAEQKIGQIGIERHLMLPASDNPPRPGPQVTVSILTSRANTFSVLGAVGQPGGPYPIQGPDYRLLDALAAARDINQNSVVDYVYVIRQGNEGNGPQPAEGTGAGRTSGMGTGGGTGTNGNGGQGNPLDALESIERGNTTNPSAPSNGPSPAPVPSPSVAPGGMGPQSSLPQYVRPITRADVTTADGRPRAGLTQADLDAAMSGLPGGAGPTQTVPVATTGPAEQMPGPGNGDMMDQALGGGGGAATQNAAAGQSVYVGGKTVQIPSTMPGGEANGAGTGAGLGARTGATAADGAAYAAQTAEQRVIRIPVDALRAGVSRYNIVIRPGDVIIAQGAENAYFYVLGHVNKPGVYALVGQKITLKMAVAAAGNLDSLAIPRRCELVRRVGNNQEVIVQVNLQKIFDGEEPDLFLKKDDLLNVGTDAVAPFLAVTRNAYRLSYGFGFVYDRNFYIQPQKIAQ